MKRIATTHPQHPRPILTITDPGEHTTANHECVATPLNILVASSYSSLRRSSLWPGPSSALRPRVRSGLKTRRDKIFPLWFTVLMSGVPTIYPPDIRSDKIVVLQHFAKRLYFGGKAIQKETAYSRGINCTYHSVGWGQIGMRCVPFYWKRHRWSAEPHMVWKLWFWVQWMAGQCPDHDYDSIPHNFTNSCRRKSSKVEFPMFLVILKL